MIESQNVSPNADIIEQAIPLAINAGASLAGVSHGGWRAPWKGKLLRADVYASVVTDADDSVRVDLHVDGASALTGTVDPVAADTTTVLPLTTSPTEFEAGDIIEPVLTTGAGDALVGTVTIVVRPLAGRERIAAGLGREG